jgi:PPE-repeat protein
MYSGPGSGPLMAAATAWDVLAGQLESFAAGYSSALTSLQGQHWSGPASAAMAAAAAPYVAWTTTTATQAGQAASQVRAAAAAYETAHAATVPPAAVAANRAQLMVLVATNFFGQNAAAIAANEAAYAEMWAQDAAAMHGYAASSSAAVNVTPFNGPPQTAHAAGQSAQTAAVAHATGSSTSTHSATTLSQLLTAIPQHLQTLSTAGLPGTSPSVSKAVLTAVSHFSTFGHAERFFTDDFQTVSLVVEFVEEAYFFGFQQHFLGDALPTPTAAVAGTTTPLSGQPAVLTNVGQAKSVGRLSVPRSWAAKTAVASPADEPTQLRKTAFRALPPWAADAATNTSGGASTPDLGLPARAAARRVVNTARRTRVRRFQMPRPPAAG